MRIDARGRRLDVVECPTTRELLMLLAGGPHFEIVKSLAEAPREVSRLADALELSDDIVSKGLRKLRLHGLVAFDQRKKYRIYRLTQFVRVSTSAERLKIDVFSREGDHLTIESPAIRCEPGSAPHASEVAGGTHESPRQAAVRDGEARRRTPDGPGTLPAPPSMTPSGSMTPGSS